MFFLFFEHFFLAMMDCITIDFIAVYEVYFFTILSSMVLNMIMSDKKKMLLVLKYFRSCSMWMH